MRRTILLSAALVVATVISPCAAQGAILWNESTNGDLSDNQAAPTALALATGVNSVVGMVGGANTQDWIALAVPAGKQLTKLVLAAYQSADAQGFTGVQAGSSFVGSPFVPGSYLGYAHFGTGATNGALPPTNLVGADLLPLAGDTTLAAGAQGFTPPLGSGTYTFLIQQLGASTSYQFDYVVAAVPEPETLTMAGAGLLGLAVVGLRRMRARWKGTLDAALAERGAHRVI